METGLVIKLGIILVVGIALVWGFIVFKRAKAMEMIKKNAMESVCTWRDREGVTHTETVYLKRSRVPIIGDWGRIYPPLNEDGSTNYTNLIFGGGKNLVKLIIILGIVAIFLFGVYDILHQAKILTENLCVLSCINNPANGLSGLNLTLP